MQWIDFQESKCPRMECAQLKEQKWELLNLWLPWCGMVTIKENGRMTMQAP